MIIFDSPIENSFDSPGCRKAGQEIIKNFEDIYTSESGKQTLKEKLNIVRLDLKNKSDKDCGKILYEEALNSFLNNEKSIFLGGDHCLTYFTASAFLEICRQENQIPFLIVFDAHPDSKISENEVPNNNQWLRKLVEHGFPSDKIIIIGLRKSTLEENIFLEENKIRVYTMKDLIELQEICDIVMEQANKNQIYISIDIDVVDSAFVPGTAKPESGGLTSRQLLYFLQRLNILKGVRAIDITEINPEKDINEITIQLGVKILGEMI